ncbi:MAG: hypothetical protein ABSC65_27340 [Acidobacteriaceae bacterium]|jgi:hypothetical protein
MAEDKLNPLDARIIRALETAPRSRVPVGFAARVAAQLPSRAEVALTPARYGQRAAMVCLWLLVALMLVFTHRAAGTSPYWFAIQSIFCAQFALLAVWLVVRDSFPTSF